MLLLFAGWTHYLLFWVNTGHASRSLRFADDATASLRQCGTWQQQYASFHQRTLRGELPPRFAVSLAVEAGLADRLVGKTGRGYCVGHTVALARNEFSMYRRSAQTSHQATYIINC